MEFPHAVFSTSAAGPGSACLRGRCRFGARRLCMTGKGTLLGRRLSPEPKSRLGTPGTCSLAKASWGHRLALSPFLLPTRCLRLPLGGQQGAHLVHNGGLLSILVIYRICRAGDGL